MYVNANMCRSRYARASYGDVFGASVRALELSISARLDSVPSTPATTAVYTLSSKKEEDRPDVFPVSTNPTRIRGAKGVAR